MLFLFSLAVLNAQDPSRFADEVAAIEKKYDSVWNPAKETVVFTGSSSIRFWKDLPDRFPEHQIVNTGFGGSQTSDLLAYSEQLIFRFNPTQVVIYEGDNDLSEAKKPRMVMRDIKKLVRRIKWKNPETGIVLLAAKPSPLRWELRRKYKKLNCKFRRFCRRDTSMEFADTWSVMMKGDEVREDLFIEDRLHMNSKGYDLWFGIIKQYIN